MRQERKINYKVKEAIHALLGELNCMGGDSRSDVVYTIAETIGTNHRTFQRAFWSVILLAQIKYADAPCDLRNKEAVALAKCVKEAAIANNFDYGLLFI